jgi:hypothetical protein
VATHVCDDGVAGVRQVHQAAQLLEGAHQRSAPCGQSRTGAGARAARGVVRGVVEREGAHATLEEESPGITPGLFFWKDKPRQTTTNVAPLASRPRSASRLRPSSPTTPRSPDARHRHRHRPKTKMQLHGTVQHAVTNSAMQLARTRRSRARVRAATAPRALVPSAAGSTGAGRGGSARWASWRQIARANKLCELRQMMNEFATLADALCTSLPQMWNCCTRAHAQRPQSRCSRDRRKARASARAHGPSAVPITRCGALRPVPCRQRRRQSVSARRALPAAAAARPVRSAARRPAPFRGARAGGASKSLSPPAAHAADARLSMAARLHVAAETTSVQWYICCVLLKNKMRTDEPNVHPRTTGKAPVSPNASSHSSAPSARYLRCSFPPCRAHQCRAQRLRCPEK